MSNSCVSIGVIDGHLIVSASALSVDATGAAVVGPDASAPSSRTFAFDLRSGTCAGRVTNFSPVFMASVQVPGEADAMLCVSNDSPGYVVDGAPMFTGVRVSSASSRSTNVIVAATATDANTTQPARAPRLTAWSGAGLAQANGIEGEARMCDLILHANLRDESSATSAIDISTAHGDGLTEAATSLTSLASITADTTNRVDRFKRRVNRTGRLHQVRIQMGSVASDNTDSDFPEMVISFRDNRRMT